MDRWEESGLVDSFRLFDQSAEKYSWWSYRAGARANNAGWRIDYEWVSDTLKDRIENAKILTEAVHSDHCPVALWIH
jgi:exodeoxyribonuclease-3